MTPLPDIPSSITLAGDKLQENGIESELMLKPAYEASVPLKAGESARLTATAVSYTHLFLVTLSNLIVSSADS